MYIGIPDIQVHCHVECSIHVLPSIYTYTLLRIDFLIYIYKRALKRSFYSFVILYYFPLAPKEDLISYHIRIKKQEGRKNYVCNPESELVSGEEEKEVRMIHRRKLPEYFDFMLINSVEMEFFTCSGKEKLIFTFSYFRLKIVIQFFFCFKFLNFFFFIYIFHFLMRKVFYLFN